MTGTRSRVGAVWVLTALGVLGCGNCGTERGKTPTDSIEASNDSRPRTLAPLPEAPDIRIPTDAAPTTGLTVVVSRPQGEWKGEVRPTVTFSKPVKSLEMVEAQRAADQAAPFARIEPALKGEWRWLGSASVEFVPEGLVPYATSYTVTVLKGLKALDSSTLEADHAFSFQTPKPEIQDLAPRANYRWIKPDETFRLLFNQPVKEADLAAAAVFELKNGTKLKAKVVSRVSIAEERRQAAEKAKKEGRSYEPLNPSMRGYQNQQTRYELAAEKPFPLDTDFTLRISGTLRGEQGPLTLGSDAIYGFKTYGPLKLVGTRFCAHLGECPYGPLVVLTSNEVDWESFKSKVTVEPPVAIDWDHSFVEPPNGSDPSPYVSLAGKWKPDTQYNLTIAPGALDVFKQRDDKGLKAQDRTSPLEPQLNLGSYHALIEASTSRQPALPVELVNLKTLKVKLWNLSATEMAKGVGLDDNRFETVLGRAADIEEDVSLTYPANQARVHAVDLSKLFKGKPQGFALVTMQSPELPRYGRSNEMTTFRSLVQVTDLAVHLKIAPKKSLAWVTRLSTGEPVDQAAITVFLKDGQPLWSGKTGADGFVDIPGTVELKLKSTESWDYPKLVVAAEKDGDASVSINTWSSGIEPFEFGLAQGWEAERPDSQGFLFTDRGVYRPGDKVFIKGVVRYRTLGQLRSAAEGSTFALTVTDSRRNKVKSENVKVGKYGTFATTAEIPKDSPTGYFSVSASGKAPGGAVQLGGGFRVEEYRAPQFRVDVSASAANLVAGDKLNASISARYLFGGAMSEAKVRWSAHRNSTVFSTPTAPDFTFAQETWWWDDNKPADVSGFFASGDGKADKKGLLSVEVGQVEAPGERPYAYTIEGEVEDVNRQRVAGRAEVTVHPASYYVGLRSTTGFMTLGNEYALDTLVVDPKGTRVKDRKVEVAVMARTWKSVRKKDASGGFTTISEPEEKQVHSCSLRSGTEAVPCKFKPASAGFFIVRASVKDDAQRSHSASLGVYAMGNEFVAWQRNDSDRIELVLDKPSYNVGDVAKVLIKSPYPTANAVFSLEREGVLERKFMKLKGSVTAVEVPITEAMVPNIFAGVLLVQPRLEKGGIELGEDPGRPSARVGMVNLSVEKKTKRLTVSVKTDKPVYQPGQPVDVEIEVKDFQGKRTPAEVTLYVVDEAVLRLTDYVTPDPIDFIFSERPLSVRMGEPLLNLVRHRSFGEKGEAQGGGGGEGEGKGFRSNFQTTVIFEPNLEAADGTLKHRFTLPDNLTTFRLMAVAVTQAERFGSGESSLRVNKPVLALPALPRFARVGDVFEAGVVVHSHGNSTAGEVTVSASVSGGAQLKGPATQTVTVAEGAPKEVRFSFNATSAGIATFRFKATRGADQDGVEEKIPVEANAAIEAVATYGDTQTQSVEGIKPPPDVEEDLGGLEVTLASTSLSNFQQGFQQLIEYPYGCLEQQSSRLVPFVALREISGQFGVPWPGPDSKKLEQESSMNAWLNAYLFPTLDVKDEKDPDAVIAKTVRSILALQDDDGAFRYWPTSYCSDSWMSAFATLSLYRAREVGFDVPPDRIARAEGYLSKVAGGRCHPCERACPDESRVMATYVLARMKKPKPSYYPELYARRGTLSLFAQSLLANAMFTGGGDKKQAQALMQELLNHSKESAKGVQLAEVESKTYATFWQSDTRSTAVALQTLTALNPEHPFVGKMTRYLTSIRQGNGEWRSTQEAAFSLMALTDVIRTKERETPDFMAAVAMGDKPLVEKTFKGRSMKVEEQAVSMKALQSASGGKESKLTFSKKGTGTLYYTALMKYAAKSPPMTPLDNGLFVQRWFEPYAGGGQSNQFYAGDLVRVRLRVASNQERHWAVFEVPLPAGLEPVNTSFGTTARLTSAPDEERRDVGYDAEGEEDQVSGSAGGGDDESWQWRYGFYSPFNHTEQRDSKVLLFADHLPAGVHVSSFVARATTPGQFMLKPARGSLMYEPEVWGRSEGGRFEVTVPTPMSQK